VGSKLSVLAAAITALALVASPAAADKTGDLMKQGIEAYKAGKYDEAARILAKAYELDQKPETLFALSQAERLSGDCTTAAEHYHKVIEQISDFNVAKLVQQNLSLCEKSPPPPPPKPETATRSNATTTGDIKPDSPPPPPPQVITRTVTRDGGTDKLTAALLGGGMLAIGVAGGLYLAAGANRDGADKALTLEDHNSLQDKANTEQTASLVAAGVGVALLGVAIYRWSTGSESSSTGVAVVPSRGGGTFALTSRW
jgi:tetratricopeptide (TPR) repeat protein